MTVPDDEITQAALGSAAERIDGLIDGFDGGIDSELLQMTRKLLLEQYSHGFRAGYTAGLERAAKEIIELSKNGDTVAVGMAGAVARYIRSLIPKVGTEK